MYSRLFATVALLTSVPAHVLIITTSLFSILLLPVQVLGQEPTQELVPPSVHRFEQFDRNQDGILDQAIIECSCVTEKDRITVIDSAGDMVASHQPLKGTDFTNDTWIYDIGADGTANLIIKFRLENNFQYAEVYDDRDGDTSVAYTIDGNEVLIEESPFWTLLLRVEGDWFRDDGQLNLNLYSELDRPILTALSNPSIASTYMPHDGHPAVSFEVKDTDHNGIPEYALRRVLADVPVRFQIGRTQLYVNVGETRSRPHPSTFFWPYLSTAPTSETDFRYFDLYPQIEIDWLNAEISNVFLPGLPVEHGYHINTLQLININEVNEIDFEMPHAFYDLANNQDNFPDLNIRLFTEHLSGEQEARLQEIRYSWNQFNTGTLQWDYKVGLVGNRSINGIIEFPDFSLQMIPYEQLPYWVTEHEWELATFVAVEDRARPSSEGIYAWSPWSGVDPVSPDNPSEEVLSSMKAYLDGIASDTPASYFNDIWRGYRGEYRFQSPGEPVLYFSPVDQRLHLKGAEYGLLILDQRRKVEYVDQDNDAFIDHWKLWSDEDLIAQLFASRDNLLYSDEERIIISEMPTTSTFETLPPRNHQEWQELRQNLIPTEENLAADNFEGMVSQFGEPFLQVVGARAHSPRLSDNGFRFVMELQPDFHVEGQGATQLQAYEPGSYLVRLGKTLQVQPLTPAQLDLNMELGGYSEDWQGTPLMLQLQANSWGNRDMNNLLLVVEAKQDGEEQELTRESVEVLSDKPVYRIITWHPSQAGNWRLSARLEDQEGDIVATNDYSILLSKSARPIEQSSAISLFSWNSSSALLLILFPFLIFVLTSLALAASQRLRRRTS